MRTRTTAVIVAESCGALWSSQLAADHPDRVEKIVYIGPAVGIAPNRPERARKCRRSPATCG